MQEISKLKIIEISVSREMIKELSYHYRIIQCITPNILNLFSDEVNEKLHLMLNTVLAIKTKQAFITNDRLVEELNETIIFLRESLLASSKFFKENYYNSLLGILTSFTFLIKDYERCKNIMRIEVH